jgi:aspartate-semialdehyde dehydrogenase
MPGSPPSVTTPAGRREAKRIVIAGASSLLGAEVRALLEESRFAGADVRLLDEPLAAGTLTAAAGEPAIILPVEEGSFDRAETVFFTGSVEFTRKNFALARGHGATVIDLSGALAQDAASTAWFPKLDRLRGRDFRTDGHAYTIPSAPATAAASLRLALLSLQLESLSVLCFQPASEAGRAGIEELETQTGQLLSFQGVGRPVYDTQVAFNLLDRFGPASQQQLGTVRDRIRAETQLCLGEAIGAPALQVLHAPVFYGSAFSACAPLNEGSGTASAAQIVEACTDAGFVVAEDPHFRPSNVSVAGESILQLAIPEPDTSRPGAWWFWGAADNFRLPAANAVKLAEMLS